MDEKSDSVREHLFIKFELLARRKRPSVRAGERILSSCYQAFSDFGNNLDLPIIWLFLATSIFAAVANVICPSQASLTGEYNYVHAIDFALHNIFRPYSIWSNDFIRTDDDWLRTFKSSSGYTGWLVVSVLASVHSTLTLVLAFLFGLAVRRRFQIA
jgi:hypothetical protein